MGMPLQQFVTHLVIRSAEIEATKPVQAAWSEGVLVRSSDVMTRQQPAQEVLPFDLRMHKATAMPGEITQSLM